MCHGSGFGRQYLTRDEKIEWLDGYAKELEQELKGVRERLEELRAK